MQTHWGTISHFECMLSASPGVPGHDCRWGSGTNHLNYQQQIWHLGWPVEQSQNLLCLFLFCLCPFLFTEEGLSVLLTYHSEWALNETTTILRNPAQALIKLSAAFVWFLDKLKLKPLPWHIIFVCFAGRLLCGCKFPTCWHTLILLSLGTQK